MCCSLLYNDIYLVKIFAIFNMYLQYVYVQHALWRHSEVDDLGQIHKISQKDLTKSQSRLVTELDFPHGAFLVNDTKGNTCLYLMQKPQTASIIKSSEWEPPGAKDCVYLTRVFSSFPRFPPTGGSAQLICAAEPTYYVYAAFWNADSKYLSSIQWGHAHIAVGEIGFEFNLTRRKWCYVDFACHVGGLVWWQDWQWMKCCSNDFDDYVHNVTFKRWRVVLLLIYIPEW